MADPASTGSETLAVVGAGLVGSLAAIVLARRGFAVDVFERRSDMRTTAISAGRSINLAISARGLFALRQVGLEDAALANAVPMRGRLIHPKQGDLAFQPYGKTDADCIHAISRGWLNRTLMDAAEATSRVRIRFQTRVASADLDRGELELHDEASGKTERRTYARIFGTDGSGSAIRAAMTDTGLAVSQEALSHGYKELTIPAEVARAHRVETHALHIWPRGSYMLIALPDVEGSFTCTLFLPFVGETSFASLDSPEAVHRLFLDQFPDAVPLLPTLAEDFFRHPTGQMVTVKCAPWNRGGRALLLGDAAHAIVPFFGQGMNCGFEDCTRLDALLGEDRDFDRVLARFAGERKPNADAIADMAVENFVEMRDKVADPRFLLEKQVERVLQQRFPDAFVSRYAYVSFTRAPYRFAYEVGEVQAGILRELCHGLDRVESLDLHRARALIDGRLVPFLAAHAPRG